MEQTSALDKAKMSKNLENRRILQKKGSYKIDLYTSNAKAQELTTTPSTC